MSYSNSLSLKDFRTEIKSILSTSRNSTYKYINLSTPAKEMIFQAAIFKTSALIEEYLKNIIYDWIYNIKKNSLTADTLPENLRFYFLSYKHLGAYQSFIQNKDERKLINKFKENSVNNLFYDDQILSNEINARDIIQANKYPSVKNIKKLFQRLGVKNVFDLVSAKTKKQFPQSLQSFLDVREAIAHQNPPQLTYNDVKNNIETVDKFVSALDRIFFSIIIKNQGEKCWRRN